MKKENLSLFKKFYLDQHQTILHFAMTYLPFESAEDVVQDCFLKIYEQWENYESLIHVRFSLYVHVRNACISALRRDTTKTNYQKATLLTMSRFNDYDIEEQLVWHETYRQLTKAIERLPTQGKRVIQLSLEGLSNQDIAETLGISLNTVKLHKKNAYKRLRSDMQESNKTINLALLFILYTIQA